MSRDSYARHDTFLDPWPIQSPPPVRQRPKSGWLQPTLRMGPALRGGENRFFFGGVYAVGWKLLSFDSEGLPYAPKVQQIDAGLVYRRREELQAAPWNSMEAWAKKVALP
jgi:hypothetical protein